MKLISFRGRAVPAGPRLSCRQGDSAPRFFRRDWRGLLAVLAALAVLPAGFAQVAPMRLQELIITATRFEVTAVDLPYATAVIDRTAREEAAPRTLPEVLREENSVMVQKTALGQGSPFIRGFTGFRTVLLIDGFRLNNAAFRDGPNQYWNTVDSWSLDSLELVKGPTSAQYGSDAVGGTVHARTARPRFSGDRPVHHASVAYRFSSAEDSHVGRLEAGGGLGPRTAWLAGITAKDFGDLRAGHPTGRQSHTGYPERDFDLKVEHRPSASTTLTVASQAVEQDEVWRTHATVYGLNWEGTRPGSNLIRQLDQGRRLTYARLDLVSLPGALREVHGGAGYQRQSEDEYRQRSNRRVELAGFDVDSLSVFAHGLWEAAGGRWLAGVEGSRDFVASYFRDYDANGRLATVRVQGPVADDATYDLLGAFVEHRRRLRPHLELTAGLRLNASRIDAGRVAAAGTGTAFSLQDRTSSMAGNLRLLQSLDRAGRWRLFGGVSQGIRAPNLSDLTRFDIAEAGQIETPVPALEPERFVTTEAGLRAATALVSGELTFYRTAISDLVIRTPTGALVSGLAEVTKRNSGRGHLHGAELDLEARLAPRLSLRWRLAWMEGTLRTYPTSAPILVEEPISRLMPLTSHAALRWDASRYWLAATTTLAARADRLATQDRVDTERIPPGGTPGYTVLGLRAGWRPNDRLLFTAAIENLTDEDYRVHGSGLNEAGRNLVLTLRWRY
ncbi:MAG: TonB-dependent receptor [Verrucomicrobia bacterium]|nr:TonB-dependent receptor [Verrucomicrobiota bacterium]